MKTLQQRIDAIREEFQDQRPDVVMVMDELVEKLEHQAYENSVREAVIRKANRALNVKRYKTLIMDTPYMKVYLP